jgi:hypothetical protein
MVSGDVAAGDAGLTPGLLVSCEFVDNCCYLISRMRIVRNAIQSP